MAITVEPARADEQPLVKRLLQLHLYEGGAEPGPDGLIDWGEPLGKFFTDARHVALLFREGNELVGFALIKLNRKPTGPDGETPVTTNFIEEFFILRPYRRRRLGTRAANLIFQTYPGRWMVTCWPGAVGEEFWRHVATASAGTQAQEFRPDEHKGFPGQCVWVIETRGKSCR